MNTIEANRQMHFHQNTIGVSNSLGSVLNHLLYSALSSYQLRPRLEAAAT